MYNGYAELRLLPPESYLDWAKFETAFDKINPGKAEEQYQAGLEIGRKNDVIGISANGTWFAQNNTPGYQSHTTSYEGIGYHAHTASLLRGMLAGCRGKFVVYRWYPGQSITETVILEGID